MLAGTVFATLALLGLSASDPSGLRYYSLGISAGLANSSVYCIRQDSRGLMWFGTFGGLSRWDGETFTTWRPRPDQASLSASVIFSLMEGDGCLWVATDGGGLSRFDMVTEGWSTWRADPADPGRLSSDRVFALGRDAEGRIWAGSADGVVNILDPKSGKVLRLWPPDVSGGDRVPASPVRCIARTLDGTMWVGTEGSGLIEVTPGLRAIGHTHEAGNPASLGSDTVRSLLVDSKGRLWIGLGNGSVDLRSGAGFEHASLPPGGAPRQAVRALGEDDSGTIWVGWAEAGIGTIDPGTGALSLPGPQGAANVRALYRDRSGLMWAGLKDGGARAYNPRSAAFSRHETMVDGTRLRGLRGLAETHDGKILAGTDGLGLVELDRRDGSVRTVPAARPCSSPMSRGRSPWQGSWAG
jgi:ligand-binding sensor domain-containing protein